MLVHGASAAVALRLRQERELERVRALLDLSGATLGAFYVALLVLLVTGIAAGVIGGWWSRAWIWLALVVFILTVAAMYVLASSYFSSLRRAAGMPYFELGKGQQAGPPATPAELAALVDSWRPALIAWTGAAGLVVIIWLMLAKPF